jgi:hypothetical protein
MERTRGIGAINGRLGLDMTLPGGSGLKQIREVSDFQSV